MATKGYWYTINRFVKCLASVQNECVITIIKKKGNKKENIAYTE